MKSPNYFISILFCAVAIAGCSPLFEASSAIDITKHLWTIPLDNSESLVVEPIINNDILFIQTDKTLSAYQLGTGELIWKSLIPHARDVSERSHQRSILVEERWVILTRAIDNSVYVFAAKNGELIWSTETENLNQYFEGGIEDVIFANGKLYIAKHDKLLSSYMIGDGDVVWRKQVPLRRSLEIMAHGEDIILGTMDSLAFFSAESGAEKLSIETPGNAWEYLIDQDRLYIYFESGGCGIASLNLISMEYNWCNLRPSPVDSDGIDMQFDEKNLYLSGGSIMAISKTTGEVVWETATRDYRKMYLSGDYVFAPDDKQISAISKSTGKVNSVLNVPEQNSELKRLPMIYGEIIFVFGDNGIDAYKIPIIN